MYDKLRVYEEFIKKVKEKQSESLIIEIKLL